MSYDGNDIVMPVGPLNGGNNSGFGNDWGSWIILFLIFGLFGNGGWGGYGGNNAGLATDFPWLLNANNNTDALISAGFANQALNGQLEGIQNGVQGVASQICGSTADIQQALCNGFAGVEAGANARQIANMQQNFASQSAITQGMNSLAMGLQNCCCENRSGIADLKYTVATENCADRSALSEGIKDLLTNQTQNTQRILDQLCADKLEQKNDIIAQLRSELQYARGQASQDVQTAAIQAGQRALANEVEQYVAPRPIPSYYVQNPNCCSNPCGCGCN